MGGSTLRMGGSDLLYNSATLQDTAVFVSESGSIFDLNGTAQTVGSIYLYNSATLGGTGAVGEKLTADQFVLKNGGTLAAAVSGKSADSTLFATGAVTPNLLQGTAAIQNVSVTGGGTLRMGSDNLLYNTATLSKQETAVFVDGVGSLFDLSGTAQMVGSIYLYNSATLGGTGAVGEKLTADQFVLKNGGTLAAAVYGKDANSTLFSTGAGPLANLLNARATVQNVSVTGGSTLRMGGNDLLYNSATLQDTALFVEGAGSQFDPGGFRATAGMVYAYNSATLGSGTLTANQFVLKNGATVNAALMGDDTDPAKPSILFATGPGAPNRLYNTATVKDVSVTDGSILQLWGNNLLNHYNSATLPDTILYVDNGTFDLQSFDQTVQYVHAYNSAVLEGTGGTLNAEQYVLKGATVNAGLGAGELFSIGGTNLLNGTAGTAIVSVSGGSTLRMGGTDRLYNSATLGKDAVVLVDGGTFDLNGFDQTIGFLSGTDTGLVTLGAGTLTTGSKIDSTEFAGVISGTGGLVKEGAGYFLLSGANAFTGLTTINNGHLIVNGSLGSDVLIGASGNLWGTGAIAGTVTNNGNILPGNSIGTLTVGNYVANPGSAYIVEVDGAGHSDLINATGAATLNGGTVAMLATGSGNDYTQRQFSYTILQAAGGVTGTFAAITSNIPVFTAALVYDDPGLVRALLTRNDLSFAALGGAETINQQWVAGVLSAASATTFTGDLNTVINSYVDDLDAAGRRAALDALGGQELHTATPMVALGLIETFNGAIGRRMDRLHHINRGAMADLHPMDSIIMSLAGETMDLTPIQQKDRNFWAQVFGTDGEVYDDEYAGSYDYTIGGLAFGGDFRVAEGLHLGVAGGYGDASIDTQHHSDADVDGWQAGIYGSYENGAFYLDALMSYADLTTDASRSIRFADIARTAKSDYDGQEWSAAAEMGYVVGMEKFKVQPFFGTSFIYLDEDGFTESGAGDISLKVDDWTTRSWKVAPGIRISRPMEFGEQGLFVPEFTARMVHEFGDDNSVIEANFIGTPTSSGFKVQGVAADRNSFELDAGFRLLSSEHLQVNLNIGTELNVDKISYSASGGIRYMW
ncbi:MAG: autotransporter domain-containing protein, partial [Desulfuromonadales bacterium]|nr:autotransporter domain-containing protein [Desulfuromonadales bacterium]